MQRVIMKSKIHRATVTRAVVDFEGSCGIAPELMHAADMVPGEQVHVVNATNGSRAVTYVIEAAPGEVTLNGAMAHLGNAGDLVILVTYAHMDERELRDFKPVIVQVDARNRVREQAAIA
jgi:aspartate 1-decarboxylase